MSYESFGRYPKANPKEIVNLYWLGDESKTITNAKGKVLAFGKAKSYGDSCLISDGAAIDCSGLNHIISFDEIKGILKCEAGFTFAEALNFLVPRGWFLPVTPGTKFVTIAGAVANDVHGKNHHVAGTFGCHVTQFNLFRSDGNYYTCSPNQNSELFNATIGGLGLTGIITWVEFKCLKIQNPFIDIESIKFSNLDEFFDLNLESEKLFDYTVSWIDCTTKGKSMGRGLYLRGNHNTNLDNLDKPLEEKSLPFPLDFPFINKLTVKAFNALYYNKQFSKKIKNVVHYNTFFYPLDAVDGWQKAYGKNGFMQYQFVIPFENDRKVLNQILKVIVDSGLSSFLTVLKSFGNIQSPGLLSFPAPGITMAIDFRNYGEKTLKELDKLDNIIKDAGGRLYPAKDSRMQGSDFKIFYPKLNEFIKFKDPKFTSDFWERMMNSK
ncbi:MAG: FAD-binding oxidoreductase [Candidatus Kapabacteria bacterium]|nr:FAD-binding oxidoreductase [Candidatus Kapabacteria bacterium]